MDERGSLSRVERAERVDGKMGGVRGGEWEKIILMFTNFN